MRVRDLAGRTFMWPTSSAKKILSAIKVFLLELRSFDAFAFFRVAIGALLLIQAAYLARDFLDLYGPFAIIQGNLNDFLINAEKTPIFTLRILIDQLAHLGLSPNQGASILYLVYVWSLLLLLVGLYTRQATIVACILHALFMNSNNLAVYGADRFTQMALFYLIFAPAAAAFSLDKHWRKILPEEKDELRGSLLLRVIQVHLCLAYFSAAFDKMQGADWRTGEAVWRSMMLPKFNHINIAWISSVPFLGRLATWQALTVEAGYAVMIWLRPTRLIWALATVALHAGIAFGLGLYFFSAVMAIFTITAFIVPFSKWDAPLFLRGL